MKSILIAIFFSVLSGSLFAQNVNEQKYKLAESFEKSGEIVKASNLYTDLVKIDITSDLYLSGLVRTYKAQNKFSDLLPYIKQRLDKKKSSAIFSIYGELLWITGKPSDANDAWESALKDFTPAPDNYLILSNIQTQLKLYDKAVTTLNTGRENLKNNKLFVEPMIKLLIATGDFKRGMDETLASLAGDNNLTQAQGRIYALNSSSDAEKYIEKILSEVAEKNDKSIIVQELYAWFLRNINEFDKALAIFVRMDKINNAQGMEIIRFAEDSRRDGQLEIAMKAYGIIIDLGKKNPYVHSALYGYARCLEDRMSKGKNIDVKSANEIVEKYRMIISEFPGSGQAYESRYRIALVMNEYLNKSDEAIKELQILAKGPSSGALTAQSALYLGNIYLAQNDLENAATTFKTVEKAYSQSFPAESRRAKFMRAEILYYKGLIDSANNIYSELTNAKETDVANDALNRSVFLEQNKEFVKPVADYAAAEFLEKRKNIPEAIKAYEKVALDASESDLGAASLKKVGTLYFNLNDYNNSVKSFNELIDKYTDNIYGDYALLMLGENYAALNNKDEAVKTLSTLLVKYPKSIYLQDARKKIRLLRGEKI